MKEYQERTSLDNLIERTLENLKTLSGTKTVFGEKEVFPDGTTIIPVSKVTIGFVVGGGEYADLSMRRVATHYPMAGGSGGGICLTPVGFIVSTASEVKFISTANASAYDKILESLSKIGENFAKKMSKEKRHD